MLTFGASHSITGTGPLPPLGLPLPEPPLPEELPPAFGLPLPAPPLGVPTGLPLPSPPEGSSAGSSESEPHAQARAAQSRTLPRRQRATGANTLEAILITPRRYSKSA